MLSVTERPCRCSEPPHWLTASCYLPGRVPESDGPPLQFSIWDLDARLDEARAEGRDEAEDCEERHCPEDCDGDARCHDDCLSVDDAVEIDTVLDALRRVTLSRAARLALAEVLGTSLDQVGVARTRGAAS